MTKPKFSLTPAPTFPGKVAIPVPGKLPEVLEFTFIGRTRDEFKKFGENRMEREAVDVVMDIISGWELEDAFNRDNVELLLQNYIGAGNALVMAYAQLLTEGRAKN